MGPVISKTNETTAAKVRKSQPSTLDSKLRPKSIGKIGLENKKIQNDNEPTTPFSPGPPAAVYKQYLEAMEKKIHDEKMERFKEHAKNVKEAAEKNKEVVETAPSTATRSKIDNGINNKESPPVKISISPTRKPSL